jgi:hypothetical protein
MALNEKTPSGTAKTLKVSAKTAFTKEGGFEPRSKQLKLFNDYLWGGFAWPACAA